MAVRNFWVEGTVDGRSTRMTGGPAGKGGGMRVRVAQRDNGGSVDAVDVYSWVMQNGDLVTAVSIDGKEVGRKVTRR